MPSEKSWASAGLRCREALRQLELEGLVTIIPNKGAYVVGISQKDVQRYL